MLTRRECLFGGAAALAAAAPPKILVGGHPWVYAAKLPGYDPSPALPDIFADMKYAGLDAVELMEKALLGESAVERIRELSGRHQLPVLGTSFGAAMWKREEAEKIFDYAALVLERLKAVGGRTFGASVGNAGRRKTEAEFDTQADLVRRLQKAASAQGIVLNLHNHTYEVQDGQWDINGTLQRVPNAKLGPDLNWLIRGGVDPVEFIGRHKGRVVFCHLRDQKADGKWSEAMGEGVTGFAAIGKALRRAGFAGDLVIELAHERDFTPTRPLKESFRLSREFVRRTMRY